MLYAVSGLQVQQCIGNSGTIENFSDNAYSPLKIIWSYRERFYLRKSNIHRYKPVYNLVIVNKYSVFSR